MPKLIAIDMDGVLADFCTASARLILQRQDVDPLAIMRKGRKAAPTASAFRRWEAGLGVTGRQFWKRINAAGSGFWHAIPLLPWAETMWREVQRVAQQMDAKVLIVTSVGDASGAAEAAMGKMQWVRTHFGPAAVSQVLPCPPHTKHFLARSIDGGNVLIDDLSSNIADWNRRGGRGILWPSVSGEVEMTPVVIDQALLKVFREIESCA